jgi:hypothetical protein
MPTTQQVPEFIINTSLRKKKISFLRAGVQCLTRVHLRARQFRFRRLLHTPWSSAVAATTSEWLSFAFLWAVRNAFQGHTCLGRVNFAWGSARAYTPPLVLQPHRPSPVLTVNPNSAFKSPWPQSLNTVLSSGICTGSADTHSCSPTPTLIKPASCGKLQYQ